MTTSETLISDAREKIRTAGRFAGKAVKQATTGDWLAGETWQEAGVDKFLFKVNGKSATKERIDSFTLAT